MTYPKLIKLLCHKYWRGTSNIRGWYYKTWYMKNIAKPLNLQSYKNWKKKRNRKNKKYKTWNIKQKRGRIKSRICFVCKKKFQTGDNITLEHIIPKSILKERKLYDNPKNHSLSHYECNQQKANNLPKKLSTP